ncbi:GFA family protein [Rhodophyticola sp. CCM32]|nr:GFA family protein [Rhodophyticola sp. CCM32]
MTGRCYCGAVKITAQHLPQTISYCHCIDCRRITGTPVAAFAAFSEDDLCLTPDQGPAVSHTPGVERWFCRDCGSPLAARFDYLPGQVYVPIGLLDQAAEFEPQLHSHADACLPWLHIDDTAPRHHGSSRNSLQAAKPDADSQA